MSIKDMIDRVAKCVRCDLTAADCQCYAKCACGNRYIKGGKCNAPIHKISASAELLAKSVAAEVVFELRSLYSGTMRNSSQTFQRGIRTVVIKMAQKTLVEWMMADDVARAKMISKKR